MLPAEETEIITVLLDHLNGDHTMRPFYCCKCGKCICEIIGNAKMLVPGTPTAIELGNLGSKTVILCRGFVYADKDTKQHCNAKYIF